MQNFILSTFLNNLSPKARSYFHFKHYRPCLDDIVSCRLDLYNTVIDDFDDDFVFDDKVELVFDIFNNVVLTQRDNINKLNYEVSQ